MIKKWLINWLDVEGVAGRKVDEQIAELRGLADRIIRLNANLQESYRVVKQHRKYGEEALRKANQGITIIERTANESSALRRDMAHTQEEVREMLDKVERLL